MKLFFTVEMMRMSQRSSWITEWKWIIFLILFDMRKIHTMKTENKTATYVKYCPNVWLAKCEEEHQKDDIIEVENRYGNVNESIVHNLVYEKDGYFFYSITRADGYNLQERAKRKAERYSNWANRADAKSDSYREASNEGKDFLVLAEPIKIGHHSEKRHRALIERNWSRMEKSVEYSNKADAHEAKAEYWRKQENKINLSMPESIEFYEYKLEKATAEHKFLKDNPDKRQHAYSLTYANKRKKEAQKNFDLAKRLWG
jgi:hypothetical protein